MVRVVNALYMNIIIITYDHSIFFSQNMCLFVCWVISFQSQNETTRLFPEVASILAAYLRNTHLFVRIYIPLPEAIDRGILLRTLLAKIATSCMQRRSLVEQNDTYGFAAPIKKPCVLTQPLGRR